MLKTLTRLIGGDPIERQLEEYKLVAEQINALEPQMRALSSEELGEKTEEFRSRLADGASLDDLLVEAFAVVREVAVRTVGMRHFDVQLIGGIALHEGKIIEMKTGEGKTLVATMPIYLNALEGKGVHLVTVNDYLARRDARWMGPIYDFLGLSVGVLQEAARTESGRKGFLYDPDRESSKEDVHQLAMVDRKAAYAADITYGTNNEFGFDYLRSNMAHSMEARVQRDHHYAILDEVDNILIDEARTPLIISGPAQEDPEEYLRMAQVVKQLNPEDFEIDERSRTVSLTEIGEDHVERLLGVPLRDPDRPEDISPEQARLLGHVEQALRAEHLFKRNKDYVVQGGRVLIVDEFTGRLMAGRRWSDGLHQAVEAKEGVKVRQENVTYATITLQNYFRMYDKLAGMTGTAMTEAEEFNKIYDVDAFPLPTNLEYVAMQPGSDLLEVEFREDGLKFEYYSRPEDSEQEPVFWRRKDYPDVVYRTEEAKFRAIAEEILRRHVIGQPLLIGTTSVELSEHLSNRLRGQSLRKLCQTMLLRDTYLERHGLVEEGMRIPDLEPLYAPLETLNAGVLRPFARELEISMNPTADGNLTRLARLLDLNASHHQRLEQVLKGGIDHSVLNAKKHDEESRIIAGAGALGAVTIATNMAGRGVDIKLGGEIAEEVLAAAHRVLRRTGQEDPENLSMEEQAQALRGASDDAVGIYESELELFHKFMREAAEVREVGGLHVLGSERHEARRIDNQLRGRAARQGDPGSSQFFISLEDELMRLFGGGQVSGLMQRLNIDDAVPIAHNIVDRTIEQAQNRVEGANFDARKHLLEYDDVLNQQREIFYGQRDRVLTKEDISDDIEEMLTSEVERHVGNALADPEGPWRLLAWLEEVQPSLNLETDHPHPSLMVSLLVQQLEGLGDPQEIKPALMAEAENALDAQYEHLDRALSEQLGRALESLENQVEQRAEMADMAIEGALVEAEGVGKEIDTGDLLKSLESAAGLRIQFRGEHGKEVRDLDPYQLREMVPRLIETSLGMRVWAGIIQALERRVGESLELDPNLPQPLDWDEAAESLHLALESKWRERAEKILGEVDRDLDRALSRHEQLEEAEKARLLIQMSYGKRSVFDRKTHQRKAVIVPRLSYTFSAARLLDGMEPEDLVDQVLDHLLSAWDALEEAIGQGEVTRLSGGSVSQLDEEWQQVLQRELGVEAFEEVAAHETFASMPEELRTRVAEILGRAMLTEAYRNLFLSVADRRWVEYLTQMEALRTSIGLEAYGQRDPLVQYKSRAFDMFQELLVSIRAGMVSRMFRARPAPKAQVQVSPTSDARPRRIPAAGRGGKAKSRRRRRRR
jgi:preprotein translocase subunit SecA